MDISSFMTWFVGQCVRIFTYVYSTLDSITFAGTSLFKLSLYIILLGTILPIILTIPSAMVSAYSVKEKSTRQKSRIKNSKEGVINDSE